MNYVHVCWVLVLPFDCGAGGNLGSYISPVVAEAPGEREVQQNVPLIGGSGKYLWDILRKDQADTQRCLHHQRGEAQAGECC